MTVFAPCPQQHSDSDLPGSDEVPFGQVFSDHMVTLSWTMANGWCDGRVEPYGSFTLPAASSVFHYGQAVFEGLKAYRQPDGSVALFRPRANAERFNLSARRLAMPELPVELFLEAIELLVRTDRDWVPSKPGWSLYLRPFMIATQPTLGFTNPSQSYTFCVIATPAAPYFGAGVPQPLNVWVCEDYSRAAPGGTGEAKASGNYAAAFAASQQAADHGCDQVVWLDSAQRTWVEEMGGMNMFFVYGGRRTRVSTPPLTGTLLPGITRRSILQLARDMGMQVEEAPISKDHWREQCESGTLTEVFACGTAAVMCPVGTVTTEAASWQVGDGNPGPVTLQLRDKLLSIQYGKTADPYGWVHNVC